jgi:aryl carrier-like protein
MTVVIGYHGTRTRFNVFEQNMSRIVNDFYGGGVAYFTDNIEVAKSYARTMYNRYGGDGMYVYETRLSFNRLFDVNNIYTGEILQRLVSDKPDQFARGANLLNLGADAIKVKSQLTSGSMRLTGDQVFRGLSNGMKNTAIARKKLMSLGFDGLRYDGGRNMGMATRHNVYLAYDANKIKITNRYIVSKQILNESEKRHTYSYI